MTLHEENRHFARTRADCEVSFKLADQTKHYEGMCSNISASGILFQTEHFVDIGKAVEIKIRPKNMLTSPLTAFIETIRYTQIESGDYQIAGVIKGIISD